MDERGFKDLLRQRAALGSEQARRDRVLIVDDDQGVRESLRFELERRYEVDVAASARQGILAMSARPVTVILDIKMKGEDGFFAFEEIRKIDAVVPILFHSAYQDAKDPFEIINEYKPFAYVTKGSDLRHLLRQVEKAVDYYHKHVTQKAELSDKLRRMSDEVERLRAMMKK